MMPQSRGTFDTLIVPISHSLVVLGDLLAADDGAELLERLGYKVPTDGDLGSLFADLSARSSALADALSQVLDAYEDGSWEQPSFPGKVLDLSNSIVEIVEAAQDLPARADAAFSAAPDFLANAGVDQLPKRLIDYLLVRYLYIEHPKLASLFELLGLTAQTFIPEADYNPDFYLVEIRWERFPSLISEPEKVLAQEYGWGTSAFSDDVLLDRLKGFLWLLGVPARSVILSPDDPETSATTNLQVPLFHGAVEMPSDGYAGVELGLRGGRVDSSTDPTDAGLAIVPYAAGELGLDLEVAEGWLLTIDGTFGAEAIAVTVRPKSGVQFDTGTNVSAILGIALMRDGAELGPLLILGNSDGSRLQLGDVAFRIRVVATEELDIAFDVRDGAVVIEAGEADGFLQKVLPPDGLWATFDFLVGWSSIDGVYFRGSASLEVTLPTHQSIGPIRIDSIYLLIGTDDTGGIDFVFATSAGLEIGPVSASVDRIGLKTNVNFPAEGGNLGLAQLAPPSFKPPTGAGLTVDTSGITGGGYLEYDPDNERYAGILQLQFTEVGLVAIGLITTRMPDGSPGVSIVISIGVVFTPPIQLSFGFTLSAVGGLIGINRTMMVDVLRDRVRAGTVDSVLFPENPIVNAPQIISDMRSVFPPEDGRFVVGPMVRIGWGSPKVIDAEIGIMIELPSPVRVAILGQVSALLPEEEAAVVELHIDVLGVVDSSKKTLSIDATLFDSRIQQYPLSGDAALRLKWGDPPRLNMSLGGFHPAYSPPPAFPNLDRLTLSLSSRSDLQLSCRMYQALTPNTLQFGASVDLYAESGGASVDGGLSFDALIYFSPFGFEVVTRGGVTARYRGKTLAGVRLRVTLSGPRPWNARGTATFEILAWDVSVRFDRSWGPSAPIKLPAVDPWEPFTAALDRPESWGARLPADRWMVEALEPAEENGQQPSDIRLHPAGTLEVRQSVLPLGVRLEKLGNAPVKEHHTFRIEAMEARGGEGTRVLEATPVEEYFAPAQFEELSDNQRLSLPSFEEMQAGVAASEGDIAWDEDADWPYELTYESKVIDKEYVAHESDAPDLATVRWHLGAILVRRNAAMVGAPGRTGLRRFEVPDLTPRVHLGEEAFTVVDVDDLSAVDLDPQALPANGSRIRKSVDQALQAHLALHPEDAGRLQIVHDFEAVA